ncbi:MAG: hypothetical protein FWD23_15545 [Oscillospiraceae bacterium]|nr:hypothetical protein [Oscillospiraceae bacterium]
MKNNKNKKNKFIIILIICLLCLYACGSEPPDIGDKTVENETEITTETTEIETTIEIITEPEPEGDEIIEIESEILFDFDQLEPETEPATTKEPETTQAPATTEETTQAPATAEPTQAPTVPATTQAPAVANVIRTALPRVDVKKHSQNTSFLIGGKCEVGAMIKVTGGLHEIFTGSDHGDFLVEIPFAAQGASTLKLTAEIPGKAPSEEIAFIVQPRRDVDYFERFGTFGVIVGYNYMSYFADCLPDFIGDNLINDSEIASLTARISKRISDLRGRGSEAEIIYLLVPNTVRIWPEDMPRRYTHYKGDTLLNQWKSGVTAGGATVIDLTDVMLANKTGEYKIWHKTDSHWTEYGAYLGYVGLMQHIAQKFPDAAPRPRSDFEFYNREVNFGDIYATLGLTLSDLCETTTFANFKFDPPRYNPDFNTGHVNLYDQNCALNMSARLIHARVQFAHTTNTNLTGLNLPSAYILRDSFEGSLHAFYTDRFSTAMFKGMWDYNFNLNEIVNLNPDYILYIISERNIKNVLYN